MGDDRPAIRLDFTRLPLMEAAIRASLRVQTPLDYDLILRIRNELKHEFTQMRPPEQIEVAPGRRSQIQFGPGVIPGVVYEGNRHGLSISLHPDLVVARWLRRFDEGAPPYPRFGVLRDTLWRVVKAHRAASPEQDRSIDVVNLSYVNFIEGRDTARVLADYFSVRAQLGITSDARKVQKIEAAWSESDDLDIRFTLEHVTATIADEKKDGYRLTTTAARRLGESAAPEDSLETLHRRLQYFFRDVISDRAKAEWGLTEANDV